MILWTHDCEVTASIEETKDTIIYHAIMSNNYTWTRNTAIMENREQLQS